MNRRGFLGGILAGLAVPAIVKAESLMKLAIPRRATLWGDGIHDDSPALTELVNGGIVLRPDGTTLGRRNDDGVLVLPQGIFSMGSQVNMQGRFRIIGSEFRARDDFVGDYLFHFRNTSSGEFSYNMLHCPQKRIPATSVFRFERGIEVTS